MKILKYLVLFLVVASASFFAVGLMNPTVKYESTVVLNKQVGHSFNAFINPFYLHKWLPGFVSARPMSGMPYAVGSTYEMTFEENGEEFILTQEMTGFEVNKLFSYELSNELLVTSVLVTFEEIDEKTKITAVSEVRGENILFRSILPFMKSEFEARDQEAYDNLKKMVEGNTTHSSLLLDLLRAAG